MNETGKNIVQQLFGVTSLAEVSPSLIEQTVSKYPYFGTAQFLLAKKLKGANAHNSDAQIQKAALHFTNPFWLNYLLHENEIAEADNVISNSEESFINASDEVFEKPVSVEPVIEDSLGATSNEDEELSKEIEQTVEPDEIVSAIEVANDELHDVKDEIIPAIEVANDELHDVKDEIVPAVEVANDELHDVKDEIVPAIEVANDELHDVKDEIVPAIEVVNDELYDVKDEIVPAIEVPNDDLHDVKAEIVPAVEESSAGIENVDEEELPAEETENDQQRLKLSSIIEQHLAEFKKPVEENAELPIKSNPYHTVDYFASQGIKADGQDKLSTKVKKFTDWLKQMKVANSQPVDLGTDTETEQMIETIAKSSNETKDVITEAMAEVLVKQGKIEKAVQLYKKLSFLNPAKSTYFAAKIDELNNK
jgi:hypothetical protein